MTKEVVEKLTDTLISEEFEEKIDACESMEDLAASLKERGVEVTADELQIYFDNIVDSANDGDALSDEELEMVSGGCFICRWIRVCF